MPERILRAATVVLHRAGAVFLVERPASARFFPSVWAFPGGKVDASDGDGDPAFRRGAIRELHEETGLDVGEDAHLAPAGRLLTPPFGPIRFDTQFFLLEVADAEEPAIIPGELVQGRWVEPARAVAEFERGLLPLAPPTLAVLRLAAAHGLAGAAAVAQATDGLPHHRRFRIEVAPGIYTLPLPTRTLPPATSTNAVVYGGASVLVVDPGPSEVEAVEPLLALLRSLASEGRRTRWVALTHHHPDHVGGLLAVAEETGAEVCAHAETEKRLPFKVDRLLADGD
ncbi:MAG TPA: NUDIX domain-containing protein, partial [Candidatus Thermoplasmatota archaeon]|nr:NUDIX domain-containing protein [Candidatus Thermoplasmatota archaeon]